MDKKHPLGDLMTSTMEKLHELVDANTVIGQPIVTPDGITLIPVSKISFGFASGGSDFQGKQQNTPNPFGGGAGAGVKITPIAFLIVKDGNIRTLSLEQSLTTPIEKLLDMTPEFIDKISAIINKNSSSAAADTAPQG